LKQINRSLNMRTGNGEYKSGGVIRFRKRTPLFRESTSFRVESTIAVITSQLNELFDVETNARQAT
jgi:hypothetical protein